jgi:acetyl-CoA carboxylase biotin carboxyl carrier protein
MKVGSRRAPLAPDPEVIRALAALLSETGLSEIEYAVGDHRIRVAREITTHAAPAVNGYRDEREPAPGAAEAGPPAALPTASTADHPGTVTAPLVGVAYLAPQPGAAPFVRVGDMISKGQTLLIIEAMKVMNQIRASRAGRLVRVFVDDSDPVEYGAPLMLIE